MNRAGMVAVFCTILLASVTWAEDAGILSFDQALDRILERSTQVGIQEAKFRSTVARDIPTKLLFFPSISLLGKQETSGPVSGLQATTRQAVADAELNLFRFGADLAAIRASLNDEKGQESLRNQVAINVEQEGVQSLVSVIQREQEVDTLRQLVKMEDESHKIAQERYQRGLLPLQEVEKVSIDLENARSRLADSEIRAGEARAALASLLGNDRIALQWPWKARLSEGDYKSFFGEGTPDLSLRPDWIAAQEQVRAEEQRLSRAWRLMLPSVDATVEYGFYVPYQQDGYWGWNGVLSVSFPIFDRLTNYSNAKVQSYAVRTAELSFEQTRRQANSEWLSAKQSFETALRSAFARERVLSISRKLYEDNLRRFQQGRSSTNDLFVDQSRLFDSQILAIQGWGAAHLAFAGLCHSLGRRLASCMIHQ